MSEFRGFRCDGCETIIEDPANRVKERTRFEGADGVVEDFFRDLCPDCTSGALTLSRDSKREVPHRRRRKSPSKPLSLDEGTVSDAAEVEQDAVA